MEIRPTTAADPECLADIDGTIESSHYLHVARAGEGLGLSWRIEQRPLRTKLIERNPIDDETRFMLKQTVAGAQEGLALVAEHEGVLVASLLACVMPENRTLRVMDLRVDYDYRRQGLGLALLYRAIHDARDRRLRAVAAQTLTNNMPAGQLLQKAGFDLAGLDTHLRSNHDLVKEAVALFWYAALE